jgi:hypothetical protein
MRIRASVVLLLFLATGVVVFFAWHFRKQSERSPTLANQIEPAALPPELGSTQPVNLAISPHQQTTTPSNPPLSSTPSASTKADQARIALSSYNDVPIIFYGKVEDQFGNPVVDASVEFTVQANNGLSANTKRGRVASDARGLFTIQGYTGENLSASPKKPGYALASTNTLWMYSPLWPDDQRAHPDLTNPVVIRMWKLQGAEPLVTIDKSFRLQHTNASLHFDLLNGEIVPFGGDLIVTIQRQAGAISGRNRLDWGVRIEAVEGGIMKSAGQEATTYSAPETGYAARQEFLFSTNAPYKWAGGFTEGFFVMSRKGQVYSKLGLSVRINDDPNGVLYVRFSGFASTNGSRNWEGDPNTFKSQ